MSRLAATLPLMLLLLACGGNEASTPATAPQTAAGAPGTADTARPSEAGPAVKSPTLLAPPGGLGGLGGPGGPGGPSSAGAVPGPVDPPWLRLDLFPGATVASSGRTARDTAGLFSTQLLLALPDGTTRDTCVETVTAAVKDAVPQLERKDGEDGRVTLTGSNEDYALTLVCGEAKGRMSAYLSYRWLRAPESP